jgi:hypothetical protein
VKIHVASALLSQTGTLTVRGTVDPLPGRVTPSGHVTVTYRVRVAGRARAKSATARLVRGRFRATLAIPTAWRQDANGRQPANPRREANGTLTVRYPGSSQERAARTTVVVRRAP